MSHVWLFTIWGLHLAFVGVSDYDWRGAATVLCGNQWHQYVIQSIYATIQPQTCSFSLYSQSVFLDSTRLDWCFHSTAIVATFVILQDRFTASCKAICCTRNCNTLTVFLLSLTCKKGYISDNDYWSTVYWFYWSTDLLPTDFTDLLKLIYWRPLSHIVITATVWIGQVRGN